MIDNDARNNLSQRLQRLIAEACSHPAKSSKRRQKLNEIVRVVMQSGRLWKENTAYYHDALQLTWMYCCQNLERYDPSRASLITWLNNYLKWRLEDFRQQQAESEARTVPAHRSGTEATTDSIANLPAPPDLPPMLEETRHWAETDSDEVLRNTLFRERPEINAQVLILQRLPPDTPWETIATEFQLTSAEAKDLPKFYSRRCLPLLRKFGSSQGYLE